MRNLFFFALAVMGAACAKSPPEARTQPTRANDTPVLTDVAPRAAADEPVPGQEPGNPPGSRPPPQPNNEDRDRVGPGRTGLPSSRVDGGGAPKPLPPGVTLDAAPL